MFKNGHFINYIIIIIFSLKNKIIAEKIKKENKKEY